jgi:Cdc6-like AAA superfamily ATPase
MSIFYILNTDEYKFEEKQIGGIISAFGNSLYNLTGLKLCNYYGEPEQSSKLAPNINILHEEVLWKNLSFNEKLDTFKKHLSEIDGINYSITIIDPFLFPVNYNNQYVHLITEIFRLNNSNKITIITNQSNFNQELYERIKSNLTQELNIIFNPEFHDRIWLNMEKNKAFFLGSSLNGIGNKICLIDKLNDADSKDIIDYINAALQNSN